MDPDENYELNLNQEENFDLADADEVENFVVGFEEPEDMELGFGDVTNNGTDDFNSLYNRPSYGGNVMTGETNIPEIMIDDALSDSSTNPVQNRVIYANLATKAESSELAKVAFSGEYDDLINEPLGFTQDEWNTLWAEY